MNQPLRINLLGNPEISRGDQPLTFATRKALALLIYLVCEPGAHRREKLAALFWPAANQESGRASLRRALAYLREALADAHCLLVTPDTLAFNADFVHELDLATLQTTVVHLPLGALGGAERAATLAHLPAVADLLRGEFLANFTLADAPEFEAWLHITRQHWQRQTRLLLDRLAQWQLAAGDWQAALATAQRWQRLDPLDEGAYRRQMQAHIAGGDRPTAQAVYMACCDLLQRELNVNPAPETVAVAAQIQQGLPKRRPPAPTPSLAADPRYALEAPLIGRRDQFGALVANFAHARAGYTTICVLEGEAGMGKTRLAEAFLSWAALQGADLLQGRAFEVGGRVPYQPVVEALQARLNRENAPDDLLSDLWLSELSRLLPDLRDRYPDLPPATSGSAAEAQTRFFEAVARLGEAWTGRAPVVWWVDDLQWADRASLDLLRFVTRRWAQAGAPILLLLTVRSEALVADPALPEWLASCSRDTAYQAITVTALDRTQVHELVLALAGQPDEMATQGKVAYPANLLRDFSHWLHRETAGQPYFLAEMLKALAEQELIHFQPGHGAGGVLDFGAVLANLDRLAGFMPATMREVLRARLVRLSAAALALLAAAAVLGRRLDFDLLYQVAGIAEDEGLRALDELLHSRLLVESQLDQAGTVANYLFAHDKLRDLVYSDAGAARRRVFHRRAFEQLRQGQAPPVETSHHAFAAGLTAWGIHESMRAGDAALRLYALHDAVQHYQRAYAALQAAAQTDELLRTMPIDPPQLYRQLGRAYELLSDLPNANAIYNAMQVYAQQHNLPTLACVALNRLAMLAIWRSFDVATANQLLAQAQQLAQASGDKAALADTLWNRAQIGVYTFDLAALAVGQEALALARELNQPDLLARALNAVAHLLQINGQWQAGVSIGEEASAYCARIGDRSMEVDCLCMLAIAQHSLGNLNAAEQAITTAYHTAQAIQNDWGMAYACFMWAYVLVDRGQHEDALKLAQEGVSKAKTAGIGPLHLINLIVLGVAQVMAGQAEAGRATLQEAWAMNQAQASAPGNTEIIASLLCTSCLRLGDRTAAYDYAQQAIAARNPQHSMTASLHHWDEIQALLSADDVAAAAAEVDHLRQVTQRSLRLQLAYQAAAGVLAHHRGEGAQARSHWQAALALAEQMGLFEERRLFATFLAYS